MSGGANSPAQGANEKAPTPGEINQDSSVNPNGKRRLTEEEKRENHTRSEHKRRETIRGHFEKICEIVPGLDPTMSRSEASVIVASHSYLRELKTIRQAFIDALVTNGIKIDQAKMRLDMKTLDYNETYEGPVDT